MTSSTLDGRAWEVRTFPAEDKILAERVREILAEAAPISADQAVAVLQERLEPLHPEVDVRLRAPLADLGGTALYVFRDGRAVSDPSELSWVDDPATARLVSDASGTYVAANEAAGRLFGLPAEEIVGQGAGTFTRVDTLVQDTDVLATFVHTHPVPVADTNVTPAGRVSTTLTLAASDGPALLTTSE